jgi:hypothetical protein
MTRYRSQLTMINPKQVFGWNTGYIGILCWQSCDSPVMVSNAPGTCTYPWMDMYSQFYGRTKARNWQRDLRGVTEQPVLAPFTTPQPPHLPMSITYLPTTCRHSFKMAEIHQKIWMPERKVLYIKSTNSLVAKPEGSKLIPKPAKGHKQEPIPRAILTKLPQCHLRHLRGLAASFQEVNSIRFSLIWVICLAQNNF